MLRKGGQLHWPLSIILSVRVRDNELDRQPGPNNNYILLDLNKGGYAFVPVYLGW